MLTNWDSPENLLKCYSKYHYFFVKWLFFYSLAPRRSLGLRLALVILQLDAM